MKKTNKGFSMVELIIVIAIMAILAGALAPALIKYINKSRLSSDVSNGQQIASAIQESLSNEAVYNSASDTNGTMEINAWLTGDTSNQPLSSEFKAILGDVTKAKSKKDNSGSGLDQSYYVDVQIATNQIKVYCGSSAGGADYMIYPTVGARFESK